MGFPFSGLRRLRMNWYWMEMTLNLFHDLLPLSIRFLSHILNLYIWNTPSMLPAFSDCPFCICLTEMPCQEQRYPEIPWWYLCQWEGDNCRRGMIYQIIGLLLVACGISCFFFGSLLLVVTSLSSSFFVNTFYKFVWQFCVMKVASLNDLVVYYQTQCFLLFCLHIFSILLISVFDLLSLGNCLAVHNIV